MSSFALGTGFVVSKDGRSRAQTTTGVDATGRQIHNVVFWERQ